MKKTFFTLVLMAVMGVLSAQTLQFEYEGTVYHDGQNIICPFDETFQEYLQHMQIRNLTDADMDVVLEQYVIETAPGALIYLCWGLCAAPADTIITRPVPVTAQSLSTDELSFHVMFTEGETGVVSVVYVAYDANHPEESIAITLLAGHGADVPENSVSLGEAYPNPASSQVHFNYSFDGNSALNAVVYNLLGQEVKAQALHGNQGRLSIDVADLQPGIYFCSIQVNNTTVKTEKFVVRH